MAPWLSQARGGAWMHVISHAFDSLRQPKREAHANCCQTHDQLTAWRDERNTPTRHEHGHHFLLESARHGL
jgi:hypothetical protein